MGNITKIYKLSPFFKITKGSTDSFTIVHTAKEVEYCITGFRLKNKDEVSLELDTIMIESSNKIVTYICLADGGEKIEKEKNSGMFNSPVIPINGPLSGPVLGPNLGMGPSI